MRQLLISGLAAALLGWVAPAPAEARGYPGPRFRVMPTELYVRQAAISDTFEIESSRLALAKSGDPGIRAFASHMIADHGATSATLSRVAAMRIGPRPSRIVDGRRARLLDRLAAAPPGPAFDALYSRMQVQSHQEAVMLNRSFAICGEDPVIADVARGNVPVVSAHLAHARRLAF